MKNNHLYRIIFTLVIGVTVLSAYIPIVIAETSKQDAADSVKTCQFKIDGMTCSMCEAMIKKSLKDSTLSAEIDSKAGTGKVVYAEGKTTCEAVSKKITEAGFKAIVVK